MKIYIVLEHPDMIYYGDAEIHGVYSSREDAEAKARESEPSRAWEDSQWDRVQIEEWDVE